MPTNDPIARAKELAAEWKAQQEEAAAACRFDRCSPEELIRIAETGRDLQGRPLRDGDDIEALDGAWMAAFGEPIAVPVDVEDGDDDQGERTAVEERPADVPLDQHPVLSQPDDAMLRFRDVVRIFGYSRSTLKRHMATGKFPAPQQTVPGQRYIGWPARQLKAWVLSGVRTMP